MNFHIITPCSRPENLPLIRESILRARNPHGYAQTWWVVFDHDRIPVLSLDPAAIRPAPGLGVVKLVAGSPFSVFGNGQRNWALDWIDEGLVYFLDDDNLLHPDLLDYLYQAGQGYLIRQEVTPGVIREAVPEVGKVDMAQIVVDRRLIETTRFGRLYASDGVFISELYRRHSDRFASIEGIRAYYNRLRPYSL